MSRSVFADRATQYGDGIFTTMEVSDGQVAMYERHVSRVLSDCQRLGLVLNESSLRQDIVQHATISGERKVLKLLVSAGDGGRGYSRPDSPQPTLHFSKFPFPTFYRHWQDEGIALEVSPVKLGKQPLLAGIKHLNRLEQVLIKQHLRSKDAVILDSDGNVVETSASNLFWLKGGTWFSSNLQSCGVAGVYRGLIIDYFTAQQIPLELGEFPLTHLLSADAALICNGLMHIVPINSIDYKAQRIFYATDVVIQLQQLIAPYHKDEYGPSC